jgi:hypothetical protein
MKKKKRERKEEDIRDQSSEYSIFKKEEWGRAVVVFVVVSWSKVVWY